MSDPTRDLQNLNLDDMPVTRSHARRTPQQGRVRERTPADQGRMNPLGRPPAPSQSSASESQRPSRRGSAVPPPTSATPPVPMSTLAQAQALFKVDGIVTEDTHIDFRLSPLDRSSGQVIERLFYDSTRGNHGASCDMPEHRRSRSPCNHIKWLIAILTRELINPTGMEPTTAHSIRRQINDLYPLIARQTKSLRTRLNTYRGGETDDESDVDDAVTEDYSQSSNSANVFARQNELCDILTSFHDSMLPADFRTACVENAPEIVHFHDCLVENNLFATLYRLAMRDRHVYKALRRLVPGNTRAIKYYRKQESRAVNALGMLDEYARVGNIDPRTAVPGCARTLREIVHEVYEDHQSRQGQSSIDLRAGEQCAASLIRLVEEVVNRRHRDFLENYNGGAASLRSMPPRNRSIYAFLISDPPTDERFAEWLRDLFVIERLPETPWVELYDRLDTIMNEVRLHTDPDNEPMAVMYTDRIARALAEYNQRFDDPSSSSGQHRMPRPE